MSNIPSVSRFHAIVNATPGSPPVVENYREIGYGTWGGIRFQDTKPAKRRREPNEAGPSTVKKAAKRSTEDEGGSTREPTIVFRTRDELMQAMQERFKQGPDVDFHASYEVIETEQSHKARVQTVANEIWKTTGYRFTVKDHPQFTNGHKTRFWCSQDEAHRSKSSRAARKAQGTLYRPRTTSSGEIMAKARFPCRSRLLISSRDSHLPGTRVITVRMHHHSAHEPYVDINLPPEVAQGVWDNYGWVAHSSSMASGSRTQPSPPMHSLVADDDDDDSQEEGTSPDHDPYEHMEDGIQLDVNQHDEMTEDIQPQSTMIIHNQSHEAKPPSHPPQPPPHHITSPPIPPQPQPPPPEQQQQPPIPNTDIYHRQMQAHIRNLREFCDGLEYQLQFNDYRMLEVLEGNGGPFLNLVADCLRKEGRLVTPEQLVPPAAHPHAHPQSHSTNESMHPHAMLNGHGHAVANGAGHDMPPPMASLSSMHRSYEGNPGINPRALGC